MEVMMTNNIATPNIEFNNNVRIPVSAKDSMPVDTGAKSNFDYDRVMMDLEDVKNFLFMLIGGNLAKVSADENRGHNLNALA